jgi:GAF domain-containing protein
MGLRGLEVALRSATAATGAEAGWVAWRVGAELEVCAYAGPDDPADWLGARYSAADAGTAGMTLSTGQPMAVRPRTGDPLVEQGPMSRLGRTPACYVSVPCIDGAEPVGVLEVVDPHDRLSFDFDDVELLSLLADIVGALLVDYAEATMPDPVVERFAAAPDHVRAAVVSLIDALGSPG